MVSEPTAPYIVLLVEDSLADRILTARALERSNNQVDLHTVEDGEEALRYLRREGGFADPGTSPRPAVILLDLNMPRMGGREFLERMRRDPELRTIPVVVLTSSELDRDINASYAEGANAYLVKPVTVDNFDELIRSFKRFWLNNGFIRLPGTGA